MFSKRSHKENAELTDRFSISENVRLIQDLPGVHRLVKLTVNEGFLAVIRDVFGESPVRYTFSLGDDLCVEAINKKRIIGVCKFFQQSDR